MQNTEYSIGVDIGSTTVKTVVLNSADQLIYKKYTRHFSKVRETAAEMLGELSDTLRGAAVRIAITGSAGLGVSRATEIPFVQEVFATRIAVDHFLPDIDAVIELGGEDAKILFLTNGTEERMNGTCAGGTGAFIDQMASLLHMTVPELDELSQKHEKIYDIASRCGVFAKSDIQPLMNQGANKADIAASIYQAIVDQTISGLAQGRRIEGRVVFLGGPLTFQQGLRDRFTETLNLGEGAIFPQNGEYYIAMGAALYARDGAEVSFDEAFSRLKASCGVKGTVDCLPPLFADQADYGAFLERHGKDTVQQADIASYRGDAYLGIDAGSTTTKLVLIDTDCRLLHSFYSSNSGELVDVLVRELTHIRELCGDRVRIVRASVTGYGEDIVKNAFHADSGIVETVAHFFAARHFRPSVDFILDIGGQDIKCFKICGGAIDSIMLNEACSSGCGSFIETFASAWGYSPADFAELGIFAEHPVNLGSRCTVFMNSSVKQAQKDGASIGDISAGLAISVVKNALYKVIRAHSVKELGESIVVQGGTFMNNAILRSFELETGLAVTRPSIAGLMGAFGAALNARREAETTDAAESALLPLSELRSFTHTASVAICKRCTNNCKLTVNRFRDADTFISGNRCERPVSGKAADELPNIYRFKLERLLSYKSGAGARGRIGLPFGLNMYENLPFWHTLLTELGFEVVVSPPSTRKTYLAGQQTIPSDTVCYPAKLMHGHIKQLLSEGVEAIFYPCMSYNFDERAADNHYNCPVVAYYPELLFANIGELKDIRFIMPYLSPLSRRSFIAQICDVFNHEYGIARRLCKRACEAAYAEYARFRADVMKFGENAVALARGLGKQIAVVCGRPYHVDPEINHGIDNIITSLGFALISEDSLPLLPYEQRGVLNQWTYHARLYSAARYVCAQPDFSLIQLVSFGCGLDAITTDEVREILTSGEKLYTQLKIDEITNLGAAKIRLRSLAAALGMR